MDCVCVHGCMDERECVCMDMNALANTDLLCGVPQILDRGESVCVCMEVALANTDLLRGLPQILHRGRASAFPCVLLLQNVFSYYRMCSLTTYRRYWTEEEHQRFLDAIQNYGHKDVKAIASVVGTRSATQVVCCVYLLVLVLVLVLVHPVSSVHVHVRVLVHAHVHEQGREGDRLGR